MAKDDYDVIVYKVLLYYYGCRMYPPMNSLAGESRWGIFLTFLTFFEKK